MLPDPLTVSFIIPAYNEEKCLGSTLESVNAVTVVLEENFEVIVADDASTDRTLEVAKQHGARVISTHHRQIAATRNAGAAVASGDLLIFVDADTLVNRAVITAAMEAVRKGAIGGGCRVEFDQPLRASARFLLPIMVNAYLATGWAAGCFLYCTRAAFQCAGGFDEGLYGSEEVTLSRALKKQGRFVILDEFVLTSGRKFRMYSGSEHFRAFFRLLSRGRSAVKGRDHMSMWYDGRREK